MRQKDWLLLTILFIYGFLSFVWSLQAVWGFTTDDAFITWLYARHLVEGQGLSWHAALSTVEGYSNFLWLLLSALVLYWHGPLIVTMKWISVASVFIGFLFLYRLGRFFLNPLLAFLPVFILSQFLGLIWWTVSGLETAFFLALAIIFVQQSVFAVQKCSLRAWGVCNVCLFLLSLTRFEGLIWAIPLLVFLFCQYQVQPGFLSKKQFKSWVLVSACCLVIPYFLYHLWHFYYFKEWIPNSYRCKAFAFSQWGVVVFDYIHVLLPFLVASLPFFIFKKNTCWPVLLWLPSLIYIFLLWSADPVITNHLRLFLAPLALFLLLPVLGVQCFLALFSHIRQHLTFLTALVVLAISVVTLPYYSFSSLQIKTAEYRDRNRVRLAVSQLLNQNASFQAKVFVGDCGIIPFYARNDLQFIDALCLNNYELSHPPYAGNLPKYIEYVLQDLKPQWMVLSVYLFSEPHTAESLLQQQNFLAYYELIAHYESGVMLAGENKKTITYGYNVYKRKPSS